MVLSYIAGPVIGAIIGYCTNFIAVKMLFYPRRELKLFGHRVPFTPGVIPKGKDRLAVAVGSVVGDKLLTQEDIEKNLIGSDMASLIADEISAKASLPLKGGLVDMAGITEEDYESKKNEIADAVTEAAAGAVSEMNLSEFILSRGGALIKEELGQTMLAMFLDDNMINSILGPMAVKLQDEFIENKDEYIRPAVLSRITEMETQSGTEVLQTFGIGEELVKSTIAAVVPDLMRSGMGSILASLNVNRIVEDKIRDMSVEELEKIVLTVMKKELNTIVNLGALIGFIIGLLMILF